MLTAAERIALGSVLVVILTILARLPVAPSLWDDLGVHLVLLGAVFVFVALAHRYRESSFWITSRPIGALLVMFTLYFTLATVPFEAIPWQADAWLFRIDRVFGLGTSPALWLDGKLSMVHVEALSLAYIFFIPYVYLSVVVGLFGRGHQERERLFAALVLIYAMAFVGYLFVPAKGPVFFLGETLSALPGGVLHDQVLAAVESSGGPHGAMPSLHLGVSLVVCLFDLANNRLRGLVYIPLVVGIVLATVALRYHWVVDLVIAALLAVLALALSRRLLRVEPPFRREVV